VLRVTATTVTAELAEAVIGRNAGSDITGSADESTVTIGFLYRAARGLPVRQDGAGCCSRTSTS